MSNKKEGNNQKKISTKCFLGTTEKCGPFKKIGDHKLYTTYTIQYIYTIYIYIYQYIFI